MHLVHSTLIQEPNHTHVHRGVAGYWRTETLPVPEPGVRLLPQNKLAGFDARMSVFRQELLESARELSSQYDQIKSEARRRLGSLFNPADYPATLDGDAEVGVGNRRFTLRRHVALREADCSAAASVR
jgi:hypothetical protein